MDIKKMIMNEMLFLEYCKELLIAARKSPEMQKEIENKKPFGYYIELESKENGKTYAPWIRLNANACYLYLHDDGTVQYQLDPMGCSGAELIDVYSFNEFKSALMELAIEDIKQYCE